MIEVVGIIRDVLEEYVNVRGVLLWFVDIVGIRDIEDIVEKIGVECFRKVLSEVDLILFVFNNNEFLMEDD